MKVKRRFEFDINSKESALDYYRNKAFSLLHFGWEWDGNNEELECGLLVKFRHMGNDYRSMFIYKDFRKRGLLKKWYLENPKTTFWTLPECNLAEYFLNNDIPFVMGERDHSEEYKKVNLKFRDKYDEFLGENWMNLIDASLFLLGASSKRTSLLNSFLSSGNYFHDYVTSVEDDELAQILSGVVKVFSRDTSNLSALEIELRDNIHKRTGGILYGY